MVYVIIGYSVLLTIILFYVLLSDRAERKRLIELIAAKDYTEYKSFEERGEAKPHRDMYTARKAKERARAELETE